MTTFHPPMALDPELKPGETIVYKLLFHVAPREYDYEHVENNIYHSSGIIGWRTCQYPIGQRIDHPLMWVYRTHVSMQQQVMRRFAMSSMNLWLAIAHTPVLPLRGAMGIINSSYDDPTREEWHMWEQWQRGLITMDDIPIATQNLFERACSNDVVHDIGLVDSLTLVRRVR